MAMEDIEEIGKRAVAAARALMTVSGGARDAALEKIAEFLGNRHAEILEANAVDLMAARESGMSDSLVDRLTLNDSRIDGMAQGAIEVAAMADPLSEYISAKEMPNGLRITKRRVPLGVVAMIFEARPNVTVDAAALCLKSGNVIILRGGKEAINSNTALAGVMREALVAAGLPADCVQLVTDTSRDSATALMELTGYVDVLIPRGNLGLIKAAVENSKVPIIETGIGNCHTYIDESADLEMGAKIIQNAKCTRPSVCNAAETLLVHKNIAGEFLPLAKKYLDEFNVELRGDAVTISILGDAVKPATEEDYYTEFLDFILAVKVVSDIDEAIEHIAKYSTLHSEAIVTRDMENARRFQNEVDAAAVYVNASTRFTDGGEFGLGAEIGISTQKLHARGPMGIMELTSSKFVIEGSGQIRV